MTPNLWLQLLLWHLVVAKGFFWSGASFRIRRIVSRAAFSLGVYLVAHIRTSYNNPQSFSLVTQT